MVARTRRMIVVGALAVALSPAGGRAAGGQDPSGADAKARAQVLAEEARAVRRMTGTVRVRYASPQRLTAGIGFVAARLPGDWACAAACDHQGLSAQFEAGPSGAQAGLGWARVIGPRTPRSSFLVRPYLGFAVRAVVLRTWNHADLEPAARTFGGVEGVFAIVTLNFTLAVYRETAGPAVGDWRVGGGFGWGF